MCQSEKTPAQGSFSDSADLVNGNVICGISAFESIDRDPDDQKNLGNKDKLFEIVGMHHH